VEQGPRRHPSYSATTARLMSLSVTRSSNRMDNKHLLVIGINSCKHLIPRLWICTAVVKATALAPLSDLLLNVIKLTQKYNSFYYTIVNKKLGKRDT
jgi:hypothetical protein